MINFLGIKIKKQMVSTPSGAAYWDHELIQEFQNVKILDPFWQPALLKTISFQFPKFAV